jgi:16S rRNA G966 N2-methylase RsmD
MRLTTIATFSRLIVSGKWRVARYRIRNRWRGLDFAYADLNALNSDPSRANEYEDSGGPQLERLFSKLTVLPSDKLLDLGCGKAGAVLTFAGLPFAQIDGVEISSRLAEIAEENLRKMGIKNSLIFNCDAAEFNDLDQYTFFYMFNPFPTKVVRAVMQNIIASNQRRKRKITLIYLSPFDHDLVVASGFQKIAEFHGGTRVIIYTV